ncbi:hypothetical protein DPMN_025986 [Dreissena polymorpha]|uniref:Uncharacterized protein n=1 Tax=Dreissena polymorpha TaxID=45954 RepID=A0A9D4RE52_DREPO|nr:hypothetical protein DPMN_025986 [Dreissena polymorpha]
MPAFHIKSSDDYLRVTTNLPLATLNSSTSEAIGSLSWLVLPYSPMLVKLGGTPSHLRRCRLITLSNPSTVVVAISYSIRGHISQGSNPYWYSHALNLPGSPVWSISFRPSWSWFFDSTDVVSVLQAGVIPLAEALDWTVNNGWNVFPLHLKSESFGDRSLLDDQAP